MIELVLFGKRRTRRSCTCGCSQLHTSPCHRVAFLAANGKRHREDFAASVARMGAGRNGELCCALEATITPAPAPGFRFVPSNLRSLCTLLRTKKLKSRHHRNWDK